MSEGLHLTGEALAQIFEAASDNCESGVDDEYVGLATLMAEVFADAANIARQHGRRRVDFDISIGPMGCFGDGGEVSDE